MPPERYNFTGCFRSANSEPLRPIVGSVSESGREELVTEATAENRLARRKKNLKEFFIIFILELFLQVYGLEKEI
jgi:hypothetical protein